MKSSVSGEEKERKPYASGVQDQTDSGVACSFCAFVLNIYPEFERMTPRDEGTFREHLKMEHGLIEEILP